jgi:hypothetical protein
MIHKKLSSKPDTHYGTNINADKSHILLQLGDGLDQVRVKLTEKEVNQIIHNLEEQLELLKASRIKDHQYQNFAYDHWDFDCQGDDFIDEDRPF